MNDENIPADPLPEVESLREMSLPAGAEERLLDRIGGEGLIVPPAGRRPLITGLVAAAATIVAFVGGVQYAQRTAALPPTPTAGERYVLLLLEPATAPIGVGDTALEAEYAAWARELAQVGRLQAGEKLSLSGRRLSPDGTEQAMDPAAPAPGDIVSGFFILTVADEAEALDLARDCPHLRHGGRVELRLIEET